MLELFIRYFLLILASSITIIVVYFKLPVQSLQQIIALLIVCVLVFVNRFILAKNKPLSKYTNLLLIFLISGFVQLLVYSSGGFYSPFLILIHLTALGAIFLFDVNIAVGFLILTIITLGTSTMLDAKLKAFFIADPWTAILYVISFISVIPIYSIVLKKYNFKDTISKILTSKLNTADTQLQLTKKREESILEGLSELVVVTDPDFKIVSCNETLKTILKLSTTDITGRYLFDVIYLKKDVNHLIDPQIILKNDFVGNKTLVLNNLFLYTKDSIFPYKVNIRVQPVANLEGIASQFIFIISAIISENSESKIFQGVSQSLAKYSALIRMMESNLKTKGLENFRIQVGLLGKIEKDILTVLELENESIRPKIDLVDIARVVIAELYDKKDLINELELQIRLIQGEGLDKIFSVQEIEKKEMPLTMLTNPSFLTPVDLKWITVLIAKILDLFVLVSLSEHHPNLETVLTSNGKSIELIVTTSFNPQNKSDINTELFFVKYYEGLELGNSFSFGSGLEGYLVKTLATILSIPVDIIYQKEAAKLMIKLSFLRKVIV